MAAAASARRTPNSQENLLREAAREGREKDVIELLTQNVSPDCPTCESSALDMALITLNSPASRKGLEDSIERIMGILLKNKANPNLPGRSGQYPLQRAVLLHNEAKKGENEERARRIVKLLLEHQADPLQKIREGQTIVDLVKDQTIKVLLLEKKVEQQEAAIRRLREAPPVVASAGCFSWRC